MVPFRYVEFYDVPRLIALRYKGKILLLKSLFSETIPLQKLTVKNVLQSPMGSAIAVSSLGVQVFVISIVAWIGVPFETERIQAKTMIVQLFGVIVFSTIFVTSYSLVSSRARQIAILRALGASRVFIARVIVGEQSLLLFAGLALGLALTSGARKLLHRIGIDVEIPHFLNLYLAAGVSGLGGALCRMLQIVRKFPSYLRTGAL